MAIGYCPECGKDRVIHYVEKEEVVLVRGEKYTGRSLFLKCDTCGEEFFDSECMIDPKTEAYSSYRKKHEMIRPEQLVRFRGENNLSIEDFATLLGMNASDLQRYENGALHSILEDKLFKFVLIDDNLSLLINMHDSDEFRLYIREKIKNGKKE